MDWLELSTILFQSWTWVCKFASLHYYLIKTLIIHTTIFMQILIFQPCLFILKVDWASLEGIFEQFFLLLQLTSNFLFRSQRKWFWTRSARRKRSAGTSWRRGREPCKRGKSWGRWARAGAPSPRTRKRRRKVRRILELVIIRNSNTNFWLYPDNYIRVFLWKYPDTNNQIIRIYLNPDITYCKS